MKKTVFRYVSFALVVSVLLFLPQVAGAAIKFGASSGGITEAQYCNADVWFMVVPVSLVIGGGDQILIWFNASWYDNRSANSSPANHYFKVNWTYGMASGFNVLSRVSTGGNVGAYSPFSVLTDPLYPPGKLGITWFASITIAPSCFDSDSKVHGIGLV